MHFPTHAGVRVHAILVLALALALLNGAADAEQLAYECGTLDNHYGPYDYSNPVHYREKLPIVERAHFNRDVESLRRGQTSYRPGEDLDYTLRAFPNHHRALYSMLQYHRQFPQAAKPPGTRYPAFCWFQRAVVFAPQDPVPYMLYGLYLSQVGDQKGRGSSSNTPSRSNRTLRRPTTTTDCCWSISATTGRRSITRIGPTRSVSRCRGCVTS
jgi:hypothetical protein